MAHPDRSGFLLRNMDERVAAVDALYARDLLEKEVSDELLYEVRAAVQDAQSALDWTATAIAERFYGVQSWTPYFPLAKRKDPPVSVRKTLHAIAALVRETVHDVRSEAGL